MPTYGSSFLIPEFPSSFSKLLSSFSQRFLLTVKLKCFLSLFCRALFQFLNIIKVSLLFPEFHSSFFSQLLSSFFKVSFLIFLRSLILFCTEFNRPITGFSVTHLYVYADRILRFIAQISGFFPYTENIGSMESPCIGIFYFGKSVQLPQTLNLISRRIS